MKKTQILALGILAISAVLFGSCDCDKPSPGPDDFLKNPSVKGAVNESGIEINKGTTPPALAGTYLTDGEIVDASYLLDDLIGVSINTEFELYNQTISGKISFRETVGGFTFSGIGGYITGNSGKFTIYGESRQSGSEAGLPNDLSINVVLLMSGVKLSNGDLSAVKGISVITEVKTSNKSYGDVKSIEGNWWMWEADFDLQTGLKSTNGSQASQSMKEIMQFVVSKLTSDHP